MSRILVQSLDDPRVQAYRRLRFANLTRWSGVFVVEGEKLVDRLLRSDFCVESVLVADGRDISALPISSETSLLVAPEPLIKGIVGFNFHRGMLACGRRKPVQDVRTLFRDGAMGGPIVVCPRTQDPTNLGAVLRVSQAFGVAAVLLGRGCADPFSRRVLRVSMGAALDLPIVPCRDLAGDLRWLKESCDVRLVATVLDRAAEPLRGAAAERRLALLFGNEDSGLEEQWIGLCDRRVTIPLAPGTDSLNVAVAAAIILHHFTA